MFIKKQISILSCWRTKYNTSSCLDCIDAVEHSQSCPIWAIYGYCYSDSNWYNFMSSNCEKSCGKCKSGKYRVIKPILPGLWKYGGIIVSKIAQIVKKTKDSSVQALTMSKFKFG